MAKMGALMSEPAFVEGIKDSVVSQPPPKILKDMAPGTIPEDVKNGIVPQIFFSYEVEDVDRWTEGFLAHGKSKTGIWEVEAKYTRSEFCDESKTRVFKSVKNSKRVGGMLFDVDLKKMGEFMADPSFKEIEKVLAVKMESLFMKQVVDAPAPVDA